MSFDPYHKWLGIPPQDQPANYYRLLAVELFEADADVIDGAADQRSAHLRKLQSGKHGKLSQQLLNEVSTARITLLDPEKRAQYDAQLRSTLQVRPSPLPSQSDLLATAVLAEQAPMAMPETPFTPTGKRPRLPQKRTPAWAVPAVISGVALLVLFGLGVAVIAMRPNNPSGNSEVLLASASDPIVVVEENVSSPPTQQDATPTDPALPAIPSSVDEGGPLEATPANPSVANPSVANPSDDDIWTPIADDGYLRECHSMGPFPRAEVTTTEAIAFLSTASVGEQFQNAPLNTQSAVVFPKETIPKFIGPAKPLTDHVKYFVFDLNTSETQEVAFTVTTFTRWKHSVVSAHLDGELIKTSGLEQLSEGTHRLIIVQHHKKSDREGRSWVTVRADGKGIMQRAEL